MKQEIFTMFILLAASTCVAQKESAWTPVINEARLSEFPQGDRKLEVYEHGVKPDWGYAADQTDTFVVLHPAIPLKQSPLYVVLHSAGHDVVSCLKCTTKVGNHDIYHAPDLFYALYLDCRANREQDWWWGGMHERDKKLMEKNAGGDPMPVERRVIDTVKWVIKKYGIDENRVYLCGNSMGGSGALGIGLPNGDLFAAIKANVPAGIEHAAQRMYFPPAALPAEVKLADPPVLIDYSGQNDRWSSGHDRFFKAMQDRKYAVLGFWGPFGHANNHAAIAEHNDLIHALNWLRIKKNEAYPVFTGASTDDPLPWPDHTDSKDAGQLNGFFRWKVMSDQPDRFEIELRLLAADEVETRFEIPTESVADVTLRRLQELKVTSGETFRWQYGDVSGKGVVDADGLLTFPGLKMTAEAVVLRVDR